MYCYYFPVLLSQYNCDTIIHIYTYINSETLVEKFFESAQHFRSGNYYTINVVPGFRSDSSLYCYRPVSYGQEMTTLKRQMNHTLDWLRTLKTDTEIT